MLGGDVRTVLGAQQILEQHLEAERQRFVASHLVNSVDLVFGSFDVQHVFSAEAVDCGHDAPSFEVLMIYLDVKILYPI